jgi:hypothetical protein
MATKSQHRTALRRTIPQSSYRQWLPKLAARTFTTIVLMIVSRWLHLPLSGE